MADFCCRFKDFRSLAANHNLHLLFPSYALTHSRNSRINYRIKRNPSRLTKNYSSDFDVISTHELSDGSLLFRFGDPSEIIKNVKIEEQSKNVEEEIETDQGEEEEEEEEDGYRVAKEVFDGDRGKEVAGSGSTDVADQANELIVNNTVVVESLDQANESIVDRSNGIEDELPVLSSITETEVSGNVDTSSILDKSFAETEYDVITTSENHEIVEDDQNNVTTILGLHMTENEIVEDVRARCNGDVGSMAPRTEETTISLFEGTEDGTESLNVLNTDENVQSGEILEALVKDELTKSKSATMSPELLMTKFVLTSGAALLPHPSKALTGGEDAYFVAGQTWLGVADGVGRWSLEGSNPGVYAQELIKICERLVSDCNGISVNNAVELLNLSVAETHSPGSSTVLIAQFDGQALNVANIGDSGFIILRNGVVYKRSSPMHYAFHFPLRIERADHPSMLAKLYKVNLEEDDVIITATDGLLDNLYDQEISTIVMKMLDANKRLEEIAEFLATRAQEIGRSGSTRSPFAEEAQTAGFSKYNGGKLDDVAVIVSLVQRQSSTENL